MTTIEAPTTTGQRMAHWRYRRGLTQAALGTLIHRSKSWVDKVERGQRNLANVHTLQQVATALRIGVDDLMPNIGTLPAHPPANGWSGVLAAQALRADPTLAARAELAPLLATWLHFAKPEDPHAAAVAEAILRP